MIKQFEVGKSYYRELPSNPNFAVVEECKKMGTEPYKLFQICEVIKRTKHFVTLKEGEYPNLVEEVSKVQKDDKGLFTTGTETEGSIHVMCDVNQLHQVMNNLFVNDISTLSTYSS